MDEQQYAADLQRLIGQFLESGVILAQQGEKERIIAHAMIETGLTVMIRISGPQTIAEELRQMAERLENSPSNYT